MAGVLADYGADVIRVAMPGDQGLQWKPHIGFSHRLKGIEQINSVD